MLKSNQQELETKIDTIIDDCTIALTSYTQGQTKVTSYDEVLIDRLKLAEQLKQTFTAERDRLLTELESKKRRDTKPGWHYRACTPKQRENRGFNDAIDQVQKLLLGYKSGHGGQSSTPNDTNGTAPTADARKETEL